MKRSFFCGLFLCLVPIIFYGWSWQNAWLTPDQQAQKLMEKKQYEQASALFADSQWQASAFYRDKAYEKAARGFQNVKSADGYYNLGNALAQLGQLQKAINAYDQALSLDSKHQDARFNRQLVASLLKEQEKQQEKNQEQNQEQDQKNQEKNQKDQPSSEENHNNDKPSQSKAQGQSHSPEEQQDPKKSEKPEQEKNSLQEEPLTKPQKSAQQSPASDEDKLAQDQWLRLIPEEPGGLMREKFLRDYLRRQHGWAQ